MEFLRNYLSKDKVILLAESMGTLTGLPLAKQRPDLFYALVATDLYVAMAANEAGKYQMTLERLPAANNDKAVANLEKIGPDPTRWDLSAWNINMAWAFRTNLPTPNLDRKLLFPLALSSPIYSLSDLFTLFMGFQWSTAQMFEKLMSDDPDVITLTTLATDYFADVQAPSKELALIEDAGHFAVFTQLDRFLAELLTRVHPLASASTP